MPYRRYSKKIPELYQIDQTNTGSVMAILESAHQQGYSNLHSNTGQSPSLIEGNAFDQ
jgi:hypothetical protein